MKKDWLIVAAVICGSIVFVLGGLMLNVWVSLAGLLTMLSSLLIPEEGEV